MIGKFIGQFLSLTGGTLGGNLSLGNNKLLFDTLSSFQSDGSGNNAFASATLKQTIKGTDTNAGTKNNHAAMQVLTRWTLSGTNASTDLLVNRTIFSGSSTGRQLLAQFQNGGTDEATLDINGIWTANGFRSPNFSANTTIYVDPVNGSDDTGDGSQIFPYQTISQATVVATSGNVIVIAAGVYANASESQIVLPAGVHLKGMGMDITVLHPNGSWPSGQSPYVVLGTGSIISDLTVDLTNSSSTNRPAAIGCLDTATNGSNQFGLNPSLYRVKGINTGHTFDYSHNNTTSATTHVYTEDCIFISNNRCFVTFLSTDVNVAVDLVRCQLLFTYAAGVSGSNNGECLFGSARLFNCIASMTDTVNTAWSSVGYQMFDVDGPLEIYGTHCLTNFPNLPAIPPIATPGIDPGFMLTSNTGLTKFGAGNTLSLPESDIGPSLNQILPAPIAHPNTFVLIVASSSASPWIEDRDAMFEVSVDPASLSASTLTLSNVNVSANVTGTSVALVDGQTMRLRVKNTNTSATSMTLAFGSTYNNGSTSISTLAAGKRAYLSYCYDADNSKWDLTGYTTGL